jgi:response regulator RpfG family c-di-GMP phosphodiesterase
MTSAEFAQKHAIRMRDVKRALKRHRIGSVRDGVRHFEEPDLLALLREKMERIKVQRARAIKGNILVVDDDEANLDFVERTLRNHYKVSRAASGAQALAIFREQPIEVILCDQRMPGMNGTEFMTEATRFRPDAIRILISAYTDSAALTQAINEAKVHYFLSKPITPDDLLAKVKAAFAELERVRHIDAILMGDSAGE